MFWISPVLATKIFARKPIVKNMIVTEIYCYRASRRIGPHTRISFSKSLAIGQDSLTFGSNICKKISNINSLKGKNITLYGRSWFLGGYIDEFEYPITNFSNQSPALDNSNLDLPVPKDWIQYGK